MTATFEPIAIVGRSCILPGAHSPKDLWQAVQSGRDLITSVPEGRWGLSAATALTPDPKHSADRAWSDRGGYVTGFDEAFRATLASDPFRRTAEDLLALDPLFHWVLHTGRTALRQAGHDGTRSERVSAVLGNLSFPSREMSRYAEHVWLGRESVDARNRFMSGLPALLLADELGLGGGAFALDAACASSLYAIKLACDQLHDGRVDLALAGAVCRSDDLFIHVGFCALDAMSRTGRSRPFHAGADGLVPAEGAAVVALKRLSDAVTAGDRVFGIIRGAGLSNDGRGRGLLAPDSRGQGLALKRAWAGAGVDRARLSLVECHATGTPIGDGTELQTLAAFFGDEPALKGLALGSLKSNLGHLITAAGAAAVLKVLGAFEAGVRPPTLHVEEPNPVLAQTPFRLLTQAEPWEADAPRVAAVSAFGFGGNNAHIILEEPGAPAAPAMWTPPASRPEVAIVGVAVRAPGVSTPADLVRATAKPDAPSGLHAITTDITLPLERLKFPPRDLQQTLAQQLLLLDAAFEATDGIELPHERTAVLVGSQSDPEVCRYGARWRVADWFADRGADWVAKARDAIVPVLQSAGVVGNMPNIPANRVGSQFDLGGPGFTVAAEEHSGIVALKLAQRMLAAGEVDVALAAAVDLSAEPVHAAAAREVLGADVQPGDAAVVLVLERLSDARHHGHRILAVLDEPTTPAPAHALRFGPGNLDLCAAVGRAHAAHDLLHVAAATVACATGQGPDGPAEHAEITSRSLTGTLQTVGVHRVGAPAPLPPAPPAAQRPVKFPAHPPEITLPADPSLQLMPPAPALPSALQAATPAEGNTGFETEPERMAPPPAADASTTGPSTNGPVGSPMFPSPAAIPAAPPAPQPLAPPSDVPHGLAPAHLVELATLHHKLSAAHQTYLGHQASLHAQFLAMRVRATQGLLQAASTGGAPPLAAPERVPQAPMATSAAALPVPSPVPIAPAVPPPPPPSASEPRPPASPARDVALAPGQAPPRKATQLPGPKWSRADLEVLASDKISRIFGEMFAIQDDFPRQVRMPEPPLLLADRVTGLDAEPGSMTTGVIWTETDVTEDAWYLHDNTMPAGAMIEAGQADLLLISWLGADFHNRGERVYRLLGCRLTYSGGLPRPGDTLHYEIHIDGHANLGDTRIFFFHYDCVDDDGQPRLDRA